MPDRDYYLKDDAKLTEYRDKYVAFLTTIFKLAGQPSPQDSACDVFALERRLPRATGPTSRTATR